MKVALQYLFNVFILFNTVFYLEHNLKLKIDPKRCTFKNLEEIWRTIEVFWKNEWQPCIYIVKTITILFSRYILKTFKSLFSRYIVNKMSNYHHNTSNNNKNKENVTSAKETQSVTKRFVKYKCIYCWSLNIKSFFSKS